MAKKNYSVLFATFSPWKENIRQPTNGMIEPMLEFFVPKVSNFVLIDEPHPGSDRLIPLIEIHSGGKLIKKKKSSLLVRWIYPLLILRNSVGTRIPFKIRDFLAVFDFFIWNRKKFDLFIGLESINALSGIILKKFGLIKTVVYYVSDYSPNRYKGGLFNLIYLYLDKLASYHSDYIWDVSVAIMPARIQAGLDVNKTAPVIHVPNALFPKQINYLPQKDIEPYSLVFAGTLGIENGADLAIEALSIVQKKMPQTTLHIFGGGEVDLKRLNKLTIKLNLQNSVFFHGFINDQIKLSREIKKFGLGLAPYKAIPGSPRWWADATKIRLYLAASLPVVTTNVPPLGKELTEAKAGLVAKDSPENFASAILTILANHKLFSEMRKKAFNKAKNNSWEKTYSNAISKMSLELT